jgi:hypothetical protein
MKIKMPLTVIICILILAVQHSISLAAHPADGQRVNDSNQYERYYDQVCQQQLGPEWDHGDIQLTLPHQPASTLTDLEWYMIYGAETSPFDKYGMEAWYLYVSTYVHRFYTEHGYIPTQLTPETLAMSGGPQAMDQCYLDVYRNPLTGEWPRLDAISHSPGDLYIKVLNPDEERYYAQYLPGIEAYCFSGEYVDPIDGKQTKVEPAEKGVLYVRVYGKTGILSNGFFYSYDTP